MAGLSRVFFLLLQTSLLSAWLAGCASQSYERATLVIPDAHGGGRTLAIDESSSYLASGTWSGRLVVWRLSDGTTVRGWQAHESEVTGLAYLGDGRLLSAGFDGSLTQWSANGRKVRQIDTGVPITAMSVDLIRMQVLTGHLDGGLRLWNIPDLSRQSILGHHPSRVYAVAIAASGEQFASSSADGRVALWSRIGIEERLTRPVTAARTLTFSPDGASLLGAGWFDLYRWDLVGGAFSSLDTDHHGLINSIQFDAEGEYLASISRQTDSAVLFLDPRNGDTLRRFQSHQLCGGRAVLSPDNRILATTADDASLMIWHLGEERVR